jgi:putative transposase
MYFEPGFLYHIFNQGNNRQNIFFCNENYLYFLAKIENFVLPYADILAYCLMPNHFHLMVHVISVGVTARTADAPTSRPDTVRSLNESIGIMLRSYTRAINKQQNRSGNLFREETKALCLNKIDKNTSLWYVSNGINVMNAYIPEKQYLNVCFNYIALNPVKDGLVENYGDWEFSSFSSKHITYNTKLINIKRIKEYELYLI